EPKPSERPVDSGFVHSNRCSDFIRESGMMPPGQSSAPSGGGSWLLQRSGGVCLMHIAFLVFVPWTRCAACSVIRMPVSLLLFDAQKNDLRDVRKKTVRVVRSQAPSGSGPGTVAHGRDAGRGATPFALRSGFRIGPCLVRRLGEPGDGIGTDHASVGRE